MREILTSGSAGAADNLSTEGSTRGTKAETLDTAKILPTRWRVSALSQSPRSTPPQIHLGRLGSRPRPLGG